MPYTNLPLQICALRRCSASRYNLIDVRVTANISTVINRLNVSQAVGE